MALSFSAVCIGVNDTIKMSILWKTKMYNSRQYVKVFMEGALEKIANIDTIPERNERRI